MCPPPNSPPPSEIGTYWNDEQIIGLLDWYKPGSSLPDNVLDSCNPYDYSPSNLPKGDNWYLVYCNEKKESDNGFWQAKGEPCEIYSNSMITGWRTTLEYLDGKAPWGQRTDWLMQEYKVTRKEFGDRVKMEDSRLLCRIFQCSGHSSKMQTAIECRKNNSVSSTNPNISNTSGLESKANLECGVGEINSEVAADKVFNSCPQTTSEQETIRSGDYMELNDLEDPVLQPPSIVATSSCPRKLMDDYFDSLALPREIEAGKIVDLQSNLECGLGAITEVEDKILNSCPQTLSEQETFRSGDYLELNDLEDIESHSSSSQTSSCPSKLSDEYFDSIALVGEIEAGTVEWSQSKQSNSRHNFIPPDRPSDVVLQPSSRGDARRIEFVEGSQATSSTKRVHNPDNRIDGHSGEKKPSSSRMKKLKMYFCFTHF